MVDMNDKAEFLGQIIDVFEDFLTEKDAVPFNMEPLEDDEPNDPDNPVYIYGEDYDTIESRLSKMMERWGIIDESNVQWKERKC